MTDVDGMHIFDEERLQSDLNLQRYTNALDTYLQTYFERYRYQQQQLESTSEWCPIDTNRLTDDEESWVFTYLIAYTIRYLRYEQKPLKTIANLKFVKRVHSCNDISELISHRRSLIMIGTYVSTFVE